MSNLVAFNVKVDSDLKEKATAIFKSLGLTKTMAINVYLQQTVYQRAIPFELRLPNKETAKALRDAHTGKYKSFDTIKELIEELDT